MVRRRRSNASFIVATADRSPDTAAIVPVFRRLYEACMERGLPIGCAPDVNVSLVLLPEEAHTLSDRRFPLQELRRRLSEQQRTADHKRIHARDVAQCFLQHQHHARRRARYQLRTPTKQKARIVRRQRIDILFRIEHVQDGCFAHLFWQRQLHEDAMHLPVVVEAAHFAQHRVFAGIFRQRNMRGMKAQRFRRLALVADIDFARRIAADENSRQSRHETVFRFKLCRLLADARAQACRERLSVDDLRRHQMPNRTEAQKIA